MSAGGTRAAAGVGIDGLEAAVAEQPHPQQQDGGRPARQDQQPQDANAASTLANILGLDRRMVLDGVGGVGVGILMGHRALRVRGLR